jgi:hypothetical protein
MLSARLELRVIVGDGSGVATRYTVSKKRKSTGDFDSNNIVVNDPSLSFLNYPITNSGLVRNLRTRLELKN